MTKPQVPEPRIAAAAVLRVGDEVLSVIRNEELIAFPGYTAFPGGKLEDEPDPPLPHPAFCGMDSAHLTGLQRELEEELAIDIYALAQAGTLTRCTRIGTATTPPHEVRRFETHFYQLDLGAKPAITPDPGELASISWQSPASVLEEYERGERLMVPPTLRIFKELADAPDCRAIGDLESSVAGNSSMFSFEPLKGLRVMPVPSNTLPPASSTNAFIIGDASGDRILVDPSPKSVQLMERLQRSCAQFGVSAIFLTHHHPDHHQYSNELARRMGLPIWLSADSAERIPKKFGADYFENIELRLVAEGDQLCTWLGIAVRAYAVPGHDAGQLAPAPESMHWMIVGDLIQGIGTVVVARPEGNMRQYFSSLQRVIDLDPQVVVPSHGIAMGSTHRIRATLAHRRQREAQVLQLHSDGHDITQMLPQIYAGLDPRLLPLARMNIESHLEKLSAEGRITN